MARHRMGMVPPWQETVLSTGTDNGTGLLGVKVSWAYWKAAVTDKASGKMLGEEL